MRRLRITTTKNKANIVNAVLFIWVLCQCSQATTDDDGWLRKRARDCVAERHYICPKTIGSGWL